MKLIKEVFEDVSFLTEEKDGKKWYYIEGPFLQCEVKNRNGRVYPKKIMMNEVNRYTETFIKQNRAFGELGHPDTPTINLERVSHIITELKEDGNNFIGKAKILETPYGNIVKNLLEGGAQLGVSSRGLGSLEQKNGANVVCSDFHLATPADIVADPSAPDAFVRSIQENKEWMLVNGVWTECDYDHAKTQIRKASTKDIEKVALTIFENFIKKL